MKLKRIFYVLAVLIIVAAAMLTMFSCIGEGNEECKHEFGQWTVTKEATCTEEGRKVRTCNLCEQPSEEAIPALSHSFGAYASNGDATCTADGTESAACTNEGCTVKDTRTVSGSRLSHSGGSATCKAPAVCQSCGASYGALNPLNHASAEFTYSPCESDDGKHDKKHACCGAVAEALAHNWDGGVPDSQTEGVTVYTCQSCAKTKKEGSPITGHTHSAQYVGAVAATCDTNGNVAYWYCSGCDTRFSDEALTVTVSASSTVIPAAHTSTDFTYAVNAQDSSKHDKKHACCGAVAETVSHSYALSGTVAVSCTSDGKNNYKCSSCNATVCETTQSKYGHSVDLWYFSSETLKEGETCVYIQTYTGSCARCGEAASKTVSAQRHTMTAEVTTPAKCNAPGVKTYTCTHGCAGSSYAAEYTDTSAHAWVKGDTVSGVTSYTCSNCSGTKTVIEYTETEATLDKSLLSENEISLNNVLMKLDSATLGLVSDGDVSLEANTLSDDDKAALANALGEDLKNLVLNSTVYDFGLKQNNTYISDFEGGKITITIPFVANASDADLVAVCYVADDGTVEVVAAAYSNGYITFEATHFSAYLPAVVSAAEACSVYGHNFTEEKTYADCDSRGYTVKNCERCGHRVVTDVVYELGHLYDGGTGTQSTCTVNGSLTYTCQREGCSHTLTVEVALVPHSYSYLNGVSATCTTDGYTTYKCIACGDEKTEVYQSYGHDMYGEYEFTLAEGAEDCTGGVIEKRYCSYDDCSYSEVTETYYDHVMVSEKLSPDDYSELISNPIVINLLDYADYENYYYEGEAPYISIVPGCLCGTLMSRVEFHGGSLFSYSDEFFEGMSYVNSSDDTVRAYVIDGSMYYDPMSGTHPDNFYVVIKIHTETDVCNKKVYADIYIGGDSEGNDAKLSRSYLIYDVISHTTKRTARVLDTSLSCYENGRKYDFKGIIVTDTCTVCHEVVNEFTESVSSSSSHYYLPTGSTYSYRVQIKNTSAYHYISFSLLRCPCGTFTVNRTGYCSYSETGTATVDGHEIDVYTCYSCGFTYGLYTIVDESNCRYVETHTYYINFNTDDNSYDAKMSYNKYDYVKHTAESSTETTTPTDDPCVSYYEKTNYCSDCNRETYHIAHNISTHDFLTATSIDEHGNVITNTVCTHDGCGYIDNVTRSSDGNDLRIYRVRYDKAAGTRSTELITYIVIDGESYVSFERSETYNDETNELLSWYQSVYKITAGGKDGTCVRVQYYSNSRGYSSVSEEPFCRYSDEYVSQDASCAQAGYSYTCCTVCGNKNYSYSEPAWSHYYQPIYEYDEELGYDVEVGYYCERCGLESADCGEHSTEVQYLFADDERIVIGYCDRYEEEGSDGIDATVNLLLLVYDNEGSVTSETAIDGVSISDNGTSRLTVSLAELKAALSALGYDENSDESYCAVMRITVADGAVWNIKLI